MSIDKFTGEYRWLSNFWPVEIEYEGITYPSVEHAYQAAKTFDSDKRLQIAAIDGASGAKRAGKRVSLRADWEHVKLQIMRELIKTKFAPNSELAVKLLRTGNQDLIEGNWWNDTYWGVCAGKGDNHLGVILMSWRSHLKELME